MVDLSDLSIEKLNTLNKDALLIVVAALQSQLDSFKSQLESANAMLADNNRQIELLTEQIRIMNHRQFGKKSEGSFTSCRKLLSWMNIMFTSMLQRITAE